MFKRFERKEISTSTQVKASIQRGIKAKIADANSKITDDQLDALLPKKPPLVQYKVGPHMMLYCRRVEHEDGSSPSDEPICKDFCCRLFRCTCNVAQSSFVFCPHLFLDLFF